MPKPHIMLVNPPIWNVYAPHLAVPLLAAVMRRHGWNVTSVDLSIEQTDWLVSAEGLTDLHHLAERRAGHLHGDAREAHEQILAAFPATIRAIDEARTRLMRPDVATDPVGFTEAATVVRNALACVSAGFPGLTFDLRGNFSMFSPRRTSDVLTAAADADRSVYAWTLARRPLRGLDDPELAVVGISVSADTQLIAAVTVAREVKRRRPDVHVVMGGNFTTRMVGRWKQEHPFFAYVDSFISYEGEDALPALCDRITGADDRPVPGLLQADGRGGLLRTGPEMVDISALPTPDFTGLPLDRYFAPGPVLPLQASRSCAWDCAFCSIPFASNKFRIRRPDDVVRDMAELSRRHGGDTFMFVDEILTLTSLRGVAKSLVQNENQLFWYGETRFSRGLDDELAGLLRASGCRRLDLGLESYNQRVLDLMRKGVKQADIEPSMEALLRNRVPVHLFCMTGFPGETESEAAATAEFSAEALRRSTEEFAVPYSTAANGPFILDLLSPVGERPDLFGVTLIAPPPEDDLAFEVDYTVTDGIGQQRARELTSGGAGPAPGTALHRATWIGDAEEWSFLWAAREAPMPERTLPLPRPRTWSLTPDTLVTPATGIGVRPGDGATVHVYAPAADAVLTLPALWAQHLRAPVTVAELTADPGLVPVLPALLRLLDCGVLTTSTCEPPVDGVRWYTSHPHTTTDVQPDGGCVLVSPERGRAARVGAAGRALWMLARNGATEAELGRRTRLPGARLETVLHELVAHHVLIPAVLAPALAGVPAAT
ncbi:hypothetical protein GCM10010112_75570 [Actinoplanes lobatus]|uniref:Radical SAM protein n=1 Tax=Actinoplanes lobatus TaxID=113568 RepID=A0A7W7HH91_9ACTN|nr:radical SAM protein [Actinoplanes lobatus]MBB4750508.1 hypothetical protein [Actinoplanes lobatus]GGN90297.1 hypothetical protein GCM10010112_75570 [Actinoplanes lobatus]GIE43815.1 hypothetical protein Alo02nite_67130 [Actinoplanes lobatus]